MNPVKEHSDLIDRVLDWGSKGCWFQTHHQWSHSVVSLSNVLYPLHTVVPTKSDSDIMFCLQSYQELKMDRSLVY